MYLWVKAFHLIFIVSWMASLLVYPRYKMHQAKSKPGEPLFETMKEASQRLKRIILTPSMIAVWLLGLALLGMNSGVAQSKWIWVKLLLVLVMTALHGVFVGIGKKIDNGTESVSVRKLQLLNEVPFILLIGIVILAVVKPF